MRRVILLCILILSYHTIKAQPGTLDASFGVGGKVLSDIDETRNVTNSVLVQPDGKIVVVGYCTPADYTGYFAIARYNKDGTIDTTFGSNGVVTTSINDDEDIAYSAVLQNDGKIIAAGYTWSGVSYDFVMVRYNSDGTLDSAFGSAGIVTTDFYGDNDKANQILLAPNGSILLAGFTGHNGFEDIDMAFAKYNANGSLDQSFGNGGLSVIPISGNDSWDVVRSAALQPDGKLVVAGFTEHYDPIKNGLYKALLVARLNENGSLDQTFGSFGAVEKFIGEHAIATSVAVGNEGTIVVLGETKAQKYNGTTDFILLRFFPNGILDVNFGNNGLTILTFDNSDDSGAALLLQPDQKILAAGYTAVSNGSTVDYAVARFNIDGSLDNTFGTGGKVTVDFQGGLDFGAAIALQSNGKIIMAGTARVGNDYDYGIVRFNNDNALPVKLAYFRASPAENEVRLEWSTSQETNSAYFEIQKSVDALHWNVLDTVAARINSFSETSYRICDQKPVEGRSYYRIEMVDVDGSYAYSIIRPVDYDDTNGESILTLYPNPTTGKVLLTGSSADYVERVSITDLKGNVILKDSVLDKTIDLSQQENGLYHVRLFDDRGRVTSKKIIISR